MVKAFCRASGAVYNHLSGWLGYPEIHRMPLLWLRVAVGFYGVGLLYALVALTRGSDFLTRIAVPAATLGMVFHFVSLGESVLASGQVTLGSVHNPEDSA